MSKRNTDIDNQPTFEPNRARATKKRKFRTERETLAERKRGERGNRKRSDIFE